MSYQVRITETAKQDLREIALYIAEHSMDNETAKRFVMELREQCKRLVDFPQSGAIPKDHVLRSLDFRYIVHKDSPGLKARRPPQQRRCSGGYTPRRC